MYTSLVDASQPTLSCISADTHRNSTTFVRSNAPVVSDSWVSCAPVRRFFVSSIKKTVKHLRDSELTLTRYRMKMSCITSTSHLLHKIYRFCFLSVSYTDSHVDRLPAVRIQGRSRRWPGDRRHCWNFNIVDHYTVSLLDRGPLPSPSFRRDVRILKIRFVFCRKSSTSPVDRPSQVSMWNSETTLCPPKTGNAYYGQ